MMLRRGHQIARHEAEIRQGNFVPAGIADNLIKAKPPGFRSAPGNNIFSAHAVLELPLLFDKQDSRSRFGQAFCAEIAYGGEALRVGELPAFDEGFDRQGCFVGSFCEGVEHVYFVVAEDYVLLVLHV